MAHEKWRWLGAPVCGCLGLCPLSVYFLFHLPLAREGTMLSRCWEEICLIRCHHGSPGSMAGRPLPPHLRAGKANSVQNGNLGGEGQQVSDQHLCGAPQRPRAQLLCTGSVSGGPKLYWCTLDPRCPEGSIAEIRQQQWALRPVHGHQITRPQPAGLAGLPVWSSPSPPPQLPLHPPRSSWCP